MRRIWAGCAVSADRFAISVGELRDEDPQSIILMYNARAERTWGFADLPRTIKSITTIDAPEQGRPIFVPMSNEGDVYFLKGAIPVEKIPGAGVLSGDAKGWGAMSHIANCNGRLFASGYGSQLYERHGDEDWRRLLDRDQPGIADSVLYWLACGPVRGPVAVCGRKRIQYREPDEREAAEIARRRAAGDEAGARAADASARTISVPRSSCLYLRDDTAWREVETGFDGKLNACLALPDDRVVAVGDHGIIVVAGGGGPAQDRSEAGLNDNLHSVGLWRREICVLGDTGVHIFGTDLDFRRTLPLPPGLALPNLLQVVGDDLFYIDYAGIAFWRGEAWERVVIPADMWTMATELPGAS